MRQGTAQMDMPCKPDPDQSFDEVKNSVATVLCEDALSFLSLCWPETWVL